MEAQDVSEPTNEQLCPTTCVEQFKIPSWEDPHNVSQSVCEFTLNEFSTRRDEYSSPSFFTHQHGYKMCLKVYAKGYGAGNYTNVSVYAHIMAGDNDDQLQWPFVGDIEVMLLNWQKDREHFKKTISISVHSCLVQVLDGTIGMGYGDSQFISHSSLQHNYDTNTEYLQDDCLRLKVEKVAVYSTPLLLKIPTVTWQNSRNFSPSLYEFTLTEFGKRKQMNNKFWSPSFYTHQHGYKVCFGVFANGDGDGKGTHVSVFVRIMAGENDNRLQWPFMGDVNIILLNWLGNGGDHSKILLIQRASCLVRVRQGGIGNFYGYSQFIPHSYLPYNRSTNTEYLQNDCLRFRVYISRVHSGCALM